MKSAKQFFALGLRVVLGVLLLLLGIAGFFAFAAGFADYPVVPPSPTAKAWIRGAYHVHTTRSDGNGSPAKVAAAAKAAGLDFVVLTDHNDLAPPAATWMDGVLLIPGVELSTQSGHLTAFGMQRPLRDVKPWGPPEQALAAVEAAGGTAVLAHPVQKKNPWRDEATAQRVPGFELYSADTFFRQALRSPFSRLLPGVGASLMNPVHGVMLLVAPEPEPTARFLGLSREQPRLALCAHDAHGLPAYETVFSALDVEFPPELLPGPLSRDAREAAKQVTQALASPQSLCVFRALGAPDGFALEGYDARTREAPVGTTLTVRLPDHVPETLEVRVWGEGRLGPDGRSIELTGPGVVQVEIWARAPGRFFGHEWRPWLVPSPVRVVPRAPGI
ncbi:CehA/McbA family metallohydrolase [Corallococcus sp. BB11-1]|uniref:PHP domain-containing protein n=1 Tax=Corallococcus sp. BB11-1 TaxID=2996783 RepID=UPI00226F662D|nr:CehA/McbA family metallohydrolase [Corallococcus sp. BB11-1]MCY1031552.1 CehA/McbA family metallohydrolase [Corallococcus sp. BB11-1]